jgi:hypothetical protein
MINQRDIETDREPRCVDTPISKQSKFGLWVRQITYYIFCAPVAITQFLQWLYLKLAGSDWYMAGYRLATAFIGSAGLRLYRTPIERWWLRYLARCAAWVMCLAGLVWFSLGAGVLTLLLVPYLRQGRRLRAAPLEPSEPKWEGRRLTFRLETLDYVSFGIIFLSVALLWLIRNKVVPMAPDGYYHALIARRIVETGRIPLWDWWEYAPLGRPHLYPPLIHLLIALFSLPFNKNIVEGIRILSVLLPPAAFFSTWYLARWLFDSRRAFLAILILGTDFFFVTTAWFGIPSILANAIVPFLLVFFLSKRRWPAAIAAAMILYAHTGVGALALLGLMIFAIYRREYFRFFLGVAGLTILFVLPWYGHVWLHRSWFFGHPMRGIVPFWLATLLKPLQLLFLNLVIALLVIRARGLIPWRETRYKLLLCQVAGFVPMLITYGGRYFLHTLQIWIIFAAVPLVRFLNPPIRWRRVGLFVLLALVPTLMLTGFGDSGFPGIRPMSSGWTTPATLLLFTKKNSYIKITYNPNLPSYVEAQKIGEYIQRKTNSRQIIHTFGDIYLKNVYLAIILAFHANRPIDSASWPEIRQPDTLSRLKKFALSDPTGIYVSIKRDEIPKDTTLTQIGRFFVGIRRSAEKD